MYSELLAQTSTVYYQFSRMQGMTEWWQWVAMIGGCALIIAYVIWMYLRDSVELTKATCWTLVVLRVCAFGGVLFYFMDLEKRSQKQITKQSKVAVLMDTSQSMGLQDRQSGSNDGDPTRGQQLIDMMEAQPFLQQMREKHQVTVYRFDEEAQPVEIASFRRTQDPVATAAPGATDTLTDALGRARLLAIIAAVLLGVAILALLIYAVFGRRSRDVEATAWSLLVGIVMLIATGIVFGVSTLQDPRLSMQQIVGLDQLQDEDANEESEASDQPSEDPDVQWAASLVPRGRMTRIGDSIRYIVNKERGEPLAGIVLFTDGGNNEGIDLSAAIAAARDGRIPIYSVGMGSDRKPVNVRVVDVEAPKRVYPGDRFPVTGYVQAYGMEGRTVDVELVSGPEGSDDEADEAFEEAKRVTLDEDGRVVTVKFDVTPDTEGTRVYKLRVKPPRDDLNSEDNMQTAQVQVVDDKNKVLLLAGGPSREYRFLRNLLFRDDDTELTVILQSGDEGLSQEADEVLFDLPSTSDELFEYDCIVAFDPNWLDFDESQINLLERWVAEQAGGLIVVSGPVYTPEWSSIRRGRDARADRMRALYPVSFFSQGAPTLSLGRFGGDTAWPLEFTRDGYQADFLRLEDDAQDSEETWIEFDGVFGYYAVKDPKPGARIYARFGDPETAIDDVLPIYLAGHLYGAGRVLFQASGEMWRLRAIHPRYFETYYTKQLRWVSQGRLLRDCGRGVLLVDKDSVQLGEHIQIRAILTDAQHMPLEREEVSAVLVQPDGTRMPLKLQKVKDASRSGTFSTQVTVLKQGDYRIELIPPEATADELLVANIKVRSTDREIATPQRNDALLKEISQKTQGNYYIGISAAMGQQGMVSVTRVIPAADQVTFVSGSPDSLFDRRLMAWLMVMICGALFLEWLIRRLGRLA